MSRASGFALHRLSTVCSWHVQGCRDRGARFSDPWQYVPHAVSCPLAVCLYM